MKSTKEIKWKYPDTKATKKQRDLIKNILSSVSNTSYKDLDLTYPSSKKEKELKIDKLTVKQASDFITKYLDEYLQIMREEHLYGLDEFEHWKEE